MAIGVMGAIRSAGLRLGEDVALIGYNDLGLTADLPIPLTTVHSSLEDIGRLSVETLLRRIRGEAVESRLLTPRLVPRETTFPAWKSPAWAVSPSA